MLKKNDSVPGFVVDTPSIQCLQPEWSYWVHSTIALSRSCSHKIGKLQIYIGKPKQYLLTCYLLTCGWRAWKLNSFKCPTRCWRRDASWRSTQTLLLRYEMIRSSTATQLCWWRRTFECLIAINSSLVYICVLVCYKKYHPAERDECDRYFLCL